MKRFLAVFIALSLFSVASTGCDHCMLHKEGTTPEAKTTVTENQSVEASEKTPEPAAP